MNLNPDELWNPMLAAEGELGKIKYPKIALPKLNGVRGCNQKGHLLARSKKPIPNLHTRKLFSIPELTDFEGELVVGDFAHEEVFSISTSGVMSKDGTPDVYWYVFDYYHPTLPFYRRLEHLWKGVVGPLGSGRVIGVYGKVVNSDAEVQAYADWALAQGYEGLVLRDPMAAVS